MTGIKSKSIITKLFLLIFILILMISSIIAFWGVNDTNKIVQEEMKSMRTQVLDEVANNVSILLSNVESMGDNIVVDSRLINILNTPKEIVSRDKDLNKEMSIYVEGLLNKEVWEYGKFNMKPELYVIGENGSVYTTYSKHKYKAENIKNQDWYEKIVKANGDTVLINTYKDENGIGPYKNIFKMGRVIKDLITGETLGILVMDLSETMLFDRYSHMLDYGSDIYITDKDGKIISSKDKRNIGKSYNIESSKEINKKIIRIQSKIDEYQWTIVQDIPINITKQISNQIAKRTIIIIIWVSLMAIIITYFMSRWLTKPIIDIKNKMIEVTNGNIKAQVEVSGEDEIGQLQSSFNTMVVQLENSINDIKEYEKQKRVAELSFLQAQINPHFLYNTLSGIRFLISMNKTEEAEEMLFRFTKLLRSLLPKASEMIELKEEISNIKNYVELQKMRYPQSFDVIYEISEEIEKYNVPSFILQPIVENAILYSMEKENNIGIIKIKGYIIDEFIKINIEDNGVGMSKEKIKNVFKKESSINSVGVINVHERIQLNYGNEYGLEIESNENEGTRVTFILPRTVEGLC